MVIVAFLLIPTGLAFALNGTPDNDILFGTTDKNDKIDGKGGSDIIFGFGNGDGKMEKLLGGSGDDELVGDQDPLAICGSILFPSCTTIGLAGDDILQGGSGNDFVVGDSGNDEFLEKAAGEDIIFGSAGDDGIAAGNGKDVVYGMAGDDNILGGNGNDLLFGNWGNDDITGGNGFDFIDCGEDPDGLDVDTARVTPGEDIWLENCEEVFDETTGEQISGTPPPPPPLDTDGDGLSDADEISGALNPFGPNDPTDETDADSDSDGISDGEELLNAPITDPNSSLDPPPVGGDTDGDGLSDVDEMSGLLNPFGITPPPGDPTDHTNPDSDGDGLSDGIEILSAPITNPNVDDTDGDGLSDGDEVLVHGSNPLVIDTDGDTLSDGLEVNTHSTSPTLADTDGDGLNDDVEITNGTDPLNPNDPPQSLTTLDVQPLIDDVNALAEDPSFPKLKSKDKNQLLSRLNKAQNAADNGDLQKACIELSSFDNKVNGLINKGKIDVTGDPSGPQLLVESAAIQDEFC